MKRTFSSQHNSRYPTMTTSKSSRHNHNHSRNSNNQSLKYAAATVTVATVLGSGYAVWYLWHKYIRNTEANNISNNIDNINLKNGISDSQTNDHNSSLNSINSTNSYHIINNNNSSNHTTAHSTSDWTEIHSSEVEFNDCNNNNNLKLREWLHKMPKVELHAHLHGSIRMDLLAELYTELANSPKFKDIIRQKEDPQQKIRHILKKHKTFKDCFALFDVIHRVVQSKEVLERITEQVLLDFGKENVKYLELRSTPRRLDHSGHSREDYVNIIVNKIIEFPKKYPKYNDMIIRFILTINNAKPISEAYESLEIAQKYINNSKKHNNECIIVGVDFAPRPIVGKEFQFYKPVLKKARNMGLNITVHFAEWYSREQQDLVLQFRPERLGHAINLKQPDWNELLKNPIPIEMCPTSNIFTRSISCYKLHPFKDFMANYEKSTDKLYPMLVCTDDYGVFETNLTNEWYEMGTAHELNKQTIQQLTINAIEFTFCSENTKKQLRNIFQRAFNEMK